MSTKSGIVVVGSCNIDQIVYTPRLPNPGETINGYKYEVGFGGKGANQCVVAAKLGAKTFMVAKVGDDDNGHNYIKNMTNHGVNVDGITITKDACTGVAPITVGNDGKNQIVVCLGANMLLSKNDVENSIDAIRQAKVMLCQLESNVEATLHALKIAKGNNLLTIFNPAPAMSNLDKRFYEYSDIICPNETEASLLTGVEVVDIETAKVAAVQLKRAGCKICVVTLGENGCVFSNNDEEPKHVPTKSVKAVDSSGAGDAFIGALAYFLCYYENLDFSEIVTRACAVAAKSVMKNGTQSSFPKKFELPDKLFK